MDDLGCGWSEEESCFPLPSSLPLSVLLPALLATVSQWRFYLLHTTPTTFFFVVATTGAVLGRLPRGFSMR